MAIGDSEYKIFGKFAVPGWLGLAWSGFWLIVDWLGRLQLLHDHWPLLKETAGKIAPARINIPVFLLSMAWILAFFFLIPPLARRWGLGKAIAGVLALLGVAALVLGILQGQHEIDKINRNYHGSRNLPNAR